MGSVAHSRRGNADGPQWAVQRFTGPVLCATFEPGAATGVVEAVSPGAGDLPAVDELSLSATALAYGSHMGTAELRQPTHRRPVLLIRPGELQPEFALRFLGCSIAAGANMRRAAFDPP